MKPCAASLHTVGWHRDCWLLTQRTSTRHPTPRVLDFGFIAARKPRAGSIKKWLKVSCRFNSVQERWRLSDLLCEAKSGATEHNWVAYGQPSPTAGLAHCGPLADISAAEELIVPPKICFMEPCVGVGPGGSGGPWITLGGHVRAGESDTLRPFPNKQMNSAPSNPQTTILNGTSFTKDAEEAYEEAARGASSAGIPAITDQDAVVASSGVVSLLASFKGSTNCAGLATLSTQGSPAVTAIVTKSSRSPSNRRSCLDAHTFPFALPLQL